MKTQSVDESALSDLLSCPFCGENPKYVRRGTDCPGMEEDFDVACGTKGCYLGDGADYWVSKEDITKIWNTRNR